MDGPRIHLSSLTEYFEMLGRPEPEHPLFTVATVKANNAQGSYDCFDSNAVISTDIYAIGLKRVISGDLYYGKSRYDCQNGTMVFFAPRQDFCVQGVRVETEGRMVMFHEDFIRGHPLGEAIKKYSFFGYAVNEALHLSPKEQALIAGIFDSIEMESQSAYDEFSREIILSQIETLLKYSDRFYRRQFLLRKEFQSSTYDRFADSFDRLLLDNKTEEIPTIAQVAECLKMTPRYLTDALRVETGKSAKEWIHLRLLDRAKDMLLESNDSVATIAYALGFEYPQYFSRLFKKKIGLTPTEYRNQYH